MFTKICGKKGQRVAAELSSTSAVIPSKSLIAQRKELRPQGHSASGAALESWTLGSTKPRASPLITLEMQGTRMVQCPVHTPLHPSCLPVTTGRLAQLGNYLLREHWLQQNSATLCQGRTIHMCFFWITRPEVLSHSANDNLTSEVSNRLQKRFYITKPQEKQAIIAAWMAAGSQVYFQVSSCGVSCNFSRRCLLNVNMLLLRASSSSISTQACFDLCNLQRTAQVHDYGWKVQGNSCASHTSGWRWAEAALAPPQHQDRGPGETHRACFPGHGRSDAILLGVITRCVCDVSACRCV